MFTCTELLAVGPIPAHGTCMLTAGAIVPGRAGAGSMHRVTQATILALAFLAASIAIEATRTSFAAVAANPAGITQASRGGAGTMQAAVGRATVQRVTGWASPEVPSTVALPLHAVPVAAAVCRLTGRLVDTHNG